uniref:Bromo domain-containing protein n=1 Tax=Acrobeloides nanus TaxID=290746 RepID=A0A914D8R8_9BILA
MNEAVPFQIPVEELIKIPDYANIVQQPMDLLTIRLKLENGQYEDAWKFCDDIWLMFENAWLFNKNKRSRIYKLTIQV